MKPDKDEFGIERCKDLINGGSSMMMTFNEVDDIQSLQKQMEFFKAKKLLLPQENSVLMNSIQSHERLLEKKKELEGMMSTFDDCCFKLQRQLNRGFVILEFFHHTLRTQKLYSNEAKERCLNLRNAYANYEDSMIRASGSMTKDLIRVLEEIKVLSLEIKELENCIKEVVKERQELKVSLTNKESELDEIKLDLAHCNESLEVLDKTSVLKEIQFIEEENRNSLTKYANDKDMLSSIEAECQEKFDAITTLTVEMKKHKVKLANLKAERKKLYDLQMKYKCCMLEHCHLSNMKSQLEKNDADIKKKNEKHKKYMDKIFKLRKECYEEKDNLKKVAEHSTSNETKAVDEMKEKKKFTRKFMMKAQEQHKNENAETEEFPEKQVGSMECTVQ